MKTKYKNLNEQMVRMKSLFTEERLYGNLVEQDGTNPEIFTHTMTSEDRDPWGISDKNEIKFEGGKWYHANITNPEAWEEVTDVTEQDIFNELPGFIEWKNQNPELKPNPNSGHVAIHDMSRMNCKRLLSKLYKDYKKLGVSGDYAGFMVVDNLKEKSGGDEQVIPKLQVCYRQFKEKDFLNKKTIAGSFKETFEGVHTLGDKTQFEKEPGDKKVKLKKWYEIDPTLKIKWKMNNIFVVDGKGTFIAAKNPDEMQPGEEKTYKEYKFGSPAIADLIKQILTGAKKGSQGGVYKIGNNGKTTPYSKIGDDAFDESGLVITKLGNKGKSLELKVLGTPRKVTSAEEKEQ